MASNPIKSTDIIESNLLKKTIEEFKAWGEVVKLVETDLKNLAKATKKDLTIIDAKDSKSVTDLVKALDNLNKSQTTLIKAQKQEIQTSKEVQKLRQEEEKTAQQKLRTKDLEEKAIIRERKEQERLEKIRLKSIKNIDNESDAYKVLTKQRTQAQNEFKRLAVQFGEDSDQAQKALKIFNELDESFTSVNKAAKDGRPFVGRYADAIKEAGIDANKTGAILLDLKNEQTELNKTLVKQRKEFGKNSDEVKATEKRLKSLNDTLEEIEKSTKQTESGIKKLTSAVKAFAAATVLLQALDFIVDIFKSSDSGADGFAKTLSRLTITVQVVVDRVIKSFDVLKTNVLTVVNDIKIGFLDLSKSILDPFKLLENTDPIKGINNKLIELKQTQNELSKNNGSLSETFSNLTDEINKKIEANDKAIDKERENIVTIANLRKEAAKTQTEIEKLTQIFDDDSQTLTNRQEKINEAIKLQEKLNIINLQAAKAEETAAKLRKQASTNNAQAEADFIDATARRIEVETQGLTELNNLRRENNSIARDIRDLELDVLLDRSDNIKTTNERIIADETVTQSKRKDLLQENINEINKSFKQQAESINKEQAQLGLSQLDFNNLLKLSTEDLLKTLKDKSGETQALRVLEIIKDRTTALQDLKETQQDLNVVDKEILNTNKDIILQEEALNELNKEGANVTEILARLEDKRAAQNITNLKEEISLLEDKNRAEGTDDSQSLVNKKQQLNDLLLQQEQKRLTKEQEIKDKALEEDKQREQQRIENFQKVQETITNLFEKAVNKRFERLQQQLDKEFDASKTQEERLQDLADKGDENALNSLQEERKRQQEIERENLRIQRQQANIQRGIQAYRVLASNNGNVAKTITDITLLETFIGGLPAFEKGTEDTGKNGKGVDGKGGSLSILHPNEGVITAKDNKRKLDAGLTNAQAIDYAIKYKHIIPELANSEKNITNIDFTNLEKAIKDLPNKMPVQSFSFDEQEKAYISIIKQNGNTKRVYTRSNGLFR